MIDKDVAELSYAEILYECANHAKSKGTNQNSEVQVDFLQRAEPHIAVLNLASFYSLLSNSYLDLQLPEDHIEYARRAFQTENDAQYLTFYILALHSDNRWNTIESVLSNLDLPALPKKVDGFGFLELCQIASEFVILRRNCKDIDAASSRIFDLIHKGNSVALTYFTQWFIISLRELPGSNECAHKLESFLSMYG